MRFSSPFARLFALSVALSLPVAIACSGKPKPPPCQPNAVAWTPGSAAVAVAPSTSASTTKPTGPLYSIEQLLNVRRANAPRALDGKRFLFLYDLSGTSQIFRSADFAVDSTGALKETPAKQLTSFPDRVSSMRISPTGNHAVFLKDTGGDENDQIYRLDLENVDKPSGETKSTALTASPKVKHTLPSFDEAATRIAFTSNARNGKDMDLWVEPFPGVEAKPAPEPEKDAKPDPKKKAPTPFLALAGNFHVNDWRGDKIVLTEVRSNVDQDLWIVDAKSKNKKLLTKHTGDESYEGARLSRDGKAVFVLSDAGREFVALTAIDIASGKRTPIVEAKHDVMSLVLPRWRSGKKPAAPPKGVEDVLMYALNVDGIEQVHMLSLDASRAKIADQNTNASGVVSSLDISPDGDSAFVAIESPRLPPEVFRIDLATISCTSGCEAVAPKRETFSEHGGIDEANLVDAELLTMKSFDGRSISLFYYAKKADAGTKLPVVVVAHGGPEAQAQPSFGPITQYLALNGYAVAHPNVRGSLGYGKAFHHLDDKEKREDSVHDLSEVGKYLATRPDVDGKRIALYGGSYGGYMVLAGLTLYPDQWAAGVDIVGIANFRTFLEQTAPYRRALREAEYGSLDKDGALLDKISPIHKVDKIKAPLFVIHGTHDPRVPIGEAIQITEALKKRGLPVELMKFEDEGHGLSKLKNRLVAYPAVVKFLDEHVKGKK